mgnify:CR=1 FL=1
MEDPVKAASPGEVWAYIGVCVGLAVSVAANVVHAADDPKATGFALILAASVGLPNLAHAAIGLKSAVMKWRQTSNGD